MTMPTVGLVLGTTDPNVPAAPSGDQNVKFQGQVVPPGAPVQYVSAYPQTATASLRGAVKPDGTTIAVDGAGTLSVVSPAGGAVVHTGNYTAVAADCGVIQVFNSATAVTLTLPAAAPFLKWTLPVQNVGAGVLTINRNGLTIDTVAANLTLSQASGVNLATDGTNYFTERGMAIASGLATISAIQQESYTSGTDTGTANAYAVTLSPAPTIGAYSELTFIVGHTNTGASTVAVNGGTAIAVKKQGSVALASGDWPAGLMVTGKYDGTFWQWGGGSAGGGGGGTVTSIALTMPSDFTVSGSPVTGAGTLAVTGGITKSGVQQESYTYAADT